MLVYGILIEKKIFKVKNTLKERNNKIMSNIGNDISVATEILAIEFSKNMFNSKKLKQLLKEKELVSLGDKETIEKVINIYGKEIKEEIQNG